MFSCEATNQTVKNLQNSEDFQDFLVFKQSYFDVFSCLQLQKCAFLQLNSPARNNYSLNSNLSKTSLAIDVSSLEKTHTFFSDVW